jgi:hypothetical protein
MLCAALRPAPIASMTVAAPVTMSPPANTPDGGGEVFVSRDVTPLVELELRGLAHDRIRVRADSEDHHVGLEFMFAARDGDGPAPARVVRLAEFHADAAHAADPALAVVEDLDRVGQPVEFHAFLLGMMDFFRARRALRFAAAVDAIHLLRAQPEADPRGIHRRVAGPDDGDAPAQRQRRVVVREFLGAHQVAPRQQFVGREHPVQGVAGDSHHRRIAGASADEDAVKTHFADHLLDREQAPDQRIALESDTQLGEVADFGVDYRVRQAEIGDAIFQNAARLMEGFEYRDVAPRLGHVRRAGHAGGSGADDPDLEVVGLDIRDVDPALCDGGVADPAFEPADGDRLQRVAHGANALALIFLRADAAADGRQQIGGGDDVVGAAKIVFGDFLDETRDIDIDRAAPDAGLVRTHQASLRFIQRIVEPVAAGHLRKVLRPLLRSLFAHRRALLRNSPYRLLFGHLKILNHLFAYPAGAARH